MQSQGVVKRNLSPASLRQPGGARTVLLRMAADEERAARIRQLKLDNPGVTWGSIAEAIGVKERSAVEWARTGGISYTNAKKLAAYFDRDIDWLWRGEEPSAPNLLAQMEDKARIDDLENTVTTDIAGVAAEFRGYVEEMLRRIDRNADMLDRQFEVLTGIMNTITKPENVRDFEAQVQALADLRQARDGAPAASPAAPAAKRGRREVA